MKKLFATILIASAALTSTAYAVDATPQKPLATITKPAQQQQETVNINTADATTLEKLKGIGPKKAEAIIAWRKANGGFKSVDQITEVKGIGKAFLEANKKYLQI